MDSKKQIIYLDNNATTPVDKRVLDAMLPYFTENYANANSKHSFGNIAYDAVKRARMQVSDLIGAEANEIVFTNGATEAINLAIKGVAENYFSKGNHIITVNTEHPAVLETCKYLESRGYIVTYLKVKSDGIIDLSELENALKKETILVSVMLANNETGVLQPIKEIAEIAHSAGAIFMTDATQAVGKILVNVDESGIDLMCFSGHKFYAPKGVGALYIRQRKNRIKIPALLHGGGQERGLRGGTLNVPGIVALGVACNLAEAEMGRDSRIVADLRDHLENELLSIENTRINGSKEFRLFNTTNICFQGVDSDALMAGLSNPEDESPVIALSNGSACKSSSIEPSHVLKAMGLSESDSFSSVRISLGKQNTRAEIETAVEAIKRQVKELRKMG
jgi:cysteine desulfurase